MRVTYNLSYSGSKFEAELSSYIKAACIKQSDGGQLEHLESQVEHLQTIVAKLVERLLISDPTLKLADLPHFLEDYETEDMEYVT